MVYLRGLLAYSSSVLVSKAGGPKQLSMPSGGGWVAGETGGEERG